MRSYDLINQNTSCNARNPFLCKSQWQMIAKCAMMASFCGYSRGLSSSPKNILPSDPCEAITGLDSRVSLSNCRDPKERDCPSYHSGFWGGKVCRKCFRDDYEISAWNGLSYLEKAYALEDAAERADHRATIEFGHDEPSFSCQDLRLRAAHWMDLAREETEARKCSVMSPEKRKKGSIPDRNDEKEASIAISSAVQCATPSPTESTEKFADLPRPSLASMDRSNKTPVSNTIDERFSTEEQTEHNIISHPPPTPCTRICRYNQNCFDGKVCIGCFRETHEISGWSSMTPEEKQCSLEDAADRFRDLAEIGSKDPNGIKGADHPDSLPLGFEGGITEAELRQQAHLWNVWGRSIRREN